MVSGHAADVNPLRRHWQSSSFNLSSDLSKLNDQLDSIFSDEKELIQTSYNPYSNYSKFQKRFS